MNKKQKAAVSPAQSGQQSNNANDWWNEVEAVTGQKPMTIDEYEKTANKPIAPASGLQSNSEFINEIKKWLDNANCFIKTARQYLDGKDVSIAKAERGQQ